MRKDFPDAEIILHMEPDENLPMTMFSLRIVNIL